MGIIIGLIVVGAVIGIFGSMPIVVVPIVISMVISMLVFLLMMVGVLMHTIWQPGQFEDIMRYCAYGFFAPLGLFIFLVWIDDKVSWKLLGDGD